MTHALKQIVLSVAALIAPPVTISTAEWAARYRILSSDVSAEPGKWVSWPYQVEPLEATSDPSVFRVVINAGTQMLKSAVGENFLGRNVDCDPGPALVLLPRKEDARDWVQDNLSAMICDNPRLAAKLIKQRATKVSFRGGSITVTSAGSPANVARKAIRYLMIDEADRLPLDAGKEGSPVALARKRLVTYRSRAKELVLSSPTVEGSVIDVEYEASDQREFLVKCPLCEYEQTLMRKWSQVRWDEKLATPRQQAESAKLYCQNCDAGWDDNLRHRAVYAGRWKANAPFNGIAGFWISELYSVTRRLADIVFDYLTKVGTGLQEFVNTSLAENYSGGGDAPVWQELVNRREEYRAGVAPRGVLVLTAGVDVHPDRIECEIVGWGRRRESWSISYEIFEGNTSEVTGQPGRPSVWEKLQAHLAEVVPHECGGEMVISRVFVDSGNQTNDVYRWVRQQPGNRIVAIKGVERGAIPVSQPVPVDVTIGGTKIRHGLKIRTVVGPNFKLELYADLKKLPPTEEQRREGWLYPDGYCHFTKHGANYGDEHFKQICAEQLVTRLDSRNRPHQEWEQIRARNEALDCRVYARAAAWDFGIDRFQERHWRELEAMFGPAQTQFELTAEVMESNIPRDLPQAPAAARPHVQPSQQQPARVFSRVVGRIRV